MYEKKHQCKTVSTTNRRKYRSLIIGFINGQWIFDYKTGRYAVQQDKIHTVADDRISFACRITIDFCPYCGEKLSIETHVYQPISSSQKDKSSEKIHTCPPLKEYNLKNPSIGSSEDENGLWMVVGEDNSLRGYYEWMLNRYSLGPEQKTQEALEKQISDSYFEYGFGISFCPFCGETLDKESVQS